MRKRREGEELLSLHQDVKRLMSAYPHEKSEAMNIMARNAYLEALDDPGLRVRVLEREPTTIEEALRTAGRLEVYERSATTTQKNMSKD